VSADLRVVLEELSQRRAGAQDANVATMTMVVYYDDPAVAGWVRERTHALAAKHPCRIVLLDGTQPETAYRIGAECEDRGECVKTQVEWIELGARQSAPERLIADVSTLAMPQAPVVLFWVASGIERDPRFAALAPRVRTVVCNSSAIDDDENALSQLVELVRANDRVTLADLAYLRLAPWQESVALFFDARNVVRELFDLRRVEIACGSAPEAYYLLGWLASRLEWSPCSPQAFCNRFGTQIDFSIVREGPPRRIRRVALSSSHTQFVARTDGDAPAILLTVRGEQHHPDRCYPMNHIDVASLVERAILTGHNDRVFVDSLVAAGEIVARRKESTSV